MSAQNGMTDREKIFVVVVYAIAGWLAVELVLWIFVGAWR